MRNRRAPAMMLRSSFKMAFASSRPLVRSALGLTAALLLFSTCARPIAQDLTAYSYDVVRTYPHDAEAFTQGLLYQDGYLYESTGLNGRSTLRRVDLESGRTLQQIAIDQTYFAEGLAAWKGELFQLTWQHQLGFVYDARTLERRRTFDYAGEGWGLADDGRHLVMSDGSSTLRFLEPDTMRVARELPVTDHGRPVTNLNELEVVHGAILANIWQTNLIAVIAPDTGTVSGYLDLSALKQAASTQPIDVLNGIAYDESGDRLFVTGKLWPRLYQIAVRPRPAYAGVVTPIQQR